MDFSGKSSSQLTDEEIKIIASRYNVGPDVSVDVAKEAGYGKAIYNNKAIIQEAVGE